MLVFAKKTKVVVHIFKDKLSCCVLQKACINILDLVNNLPILCYRTDLLCLSHTLN